MDRREAIKRTGLILGYAVSASTIAGLMAGCSAGGAREVDDRTGVLNRGDQRFFTDAEMDAIRAISDTILPRTESPGATDAGVDAFIDLIVRDFYDRDQQEVFRQGLRDLDQTCNDKYGKSFVRCTPEEQFAEVSKLDEETFGKRQEMEAPEGSRPFFSTIKELTIIGYFTSELIGEKYLNYDPVPGGYHGCIPLEEVGNKAWSLQ